MKKDVLEQIVDDYLKFSGYFTTHNVGFRPRADHTDYVKNQDSVYSDVDIVGYHPAKDGVARVMAVSCKAWQAGFDASAKLAELRNEKKNPKRATWRHFREHYGVVGSPVAAKIASIPSSLKLRTAPFLWRTTRTAPAKYAFIIFAAVCNRKALVMFEDWTRC
jgi:hypothetical protein